MDDVDRIIAQWARERPDLDVGPMELIGRLGRVTRHMSREMEKTFTRHGLNAATFDVLATLRRSGSPYALSPGDLMATMMVTSGTVTNRIDQLEQAGFVSRTQSPDDRRSVLVALTQSGRSLIDVVVADHVATQKRLVALLDPGDKEQLGSILRRYLEAMGEGGDG